MFGSIYPPHNQPPPDIKQNLGGAGQLFCTINLDGGTITALIKQKTIVGQTSPEF